MSTLQTGEERPKKIYLNMNSEIPTSNNACHNPQISILAITTSHKLKQQMWKHIFH